MKGRGNGTLIRIWSLIAFCFYCIRFALSECGGLVRGVVGQIRRPIYYCTAHLMVGTNMFFSFPFCCCKVGKNYPLHKLSLIAEID